MTALYILSINPKGKDGEKKCQIRLKTYEKHSHCYIKVFKDQKYTYCNRKTYKGHKHKFRYAPIQNSNINTMPFFLTFLCRKNWLKIFKILIFYSDKYKGSLISFYFIDTQ